LAGAFLLRQRLKKGVSGSIGGYPSARIAGQAV
jgi:hypothetical protein